MLNKAIALLLGAVIVCVVGYGVLRVSVALQTSVTQTVSTALVDLGR